MSSFIELNGAPGAATTTIGSAATLLTGAKSLNGSYLAWVPGRMGFTSSDSDENSVVYPSGAECATASVAMMALAPGRFSTKNDWPVDALMSAARMRAITSVGPPAANPTTIFTGFAGYPCAAATLHNANRARAADILLMSPPSPAGTS